MQATESNSRCKEAEALELGLKIVSFLRSSTDDTSIASAALDAARAVFGVTPDVTPEWRPESDPTSCS